MAGVIGKVRSISIALLFASASHAATGFHEYWLKASVDHVDAHVTVLMLIRNGHRYLRRLDLDLLDIPQPSVRSLHHRSEEYVPASSLKTYNFVVDDIASRIYFYHRKKPDLANPHLGELLLTVSINQQTLRNPLLFRFENGKLYAPVATMKAMGIVPEKVWTPLLSGAMPLHALAGEKFAIEYNRLSLVLSVDPRYLEKTRLSADGVHTATSRFGTTTRGERPQGVSAVFGYDFVGLYDSERQWTRSGDYKLSLGGSRASCDSDYVDPPYGDSLRRLDSSCAIFWPESTTSLSIGDGIAFGGPLSQPVRYGGLHVGTDFGLQPNLVTLPVNNISGTARVPSTIEIWVDRMLAVRTQVPAGPFDIGNIPLHTGAGTIQATITSPTGVTRVIRQPFYSDLSLLAPGLTDWGLSVGKLRYDYGMISDRYQDQFGSFHVRQGISDEITSKFALQATRRLRMASAGVAFAIGSLGVADLEVARSRLAGGENGNAYRWRVSHQGEFFNLSYQIQKYQATYHDLAYLSTGGPPRTTRQISAGVNFSHNLSLSATRYQQRRFDGSRVEVDRLSANIRLGAFGNLLLSALSSRQSNSEIAYAAQLTVPFGERSNTSAWAQRQGGDLQQRIGVQTNPPAGSGVGYWLQAGRSAATHTGAGEFTWQTSTNRVALQGREMGASRTGYADISGSILLSSAGLALSRTTRDSYAVVNVGAPDVPVYADGQQRAVSDADGEAVVPGLRPFDENRITIKADDVPFAMQPDRLSHTVIPGMRTVSSVDFGLSAAHYLTGHLVLINGRPVTKGAQLVARNADVTSIVGAGGSFFINNRSSAKSTMVLEASWVNGDCVARIRLRENKPSVVTDLGDVICH